MKRISIVSTFFLLSLISCKVNTPITSAQEHAIPFGVNLAGAEFGKIGSDEYGYPTKEDLDYFHSKGLTLIRLPFKWERIQPEMNNPLDEKELANMKSFVEDAQEKGMWVILDMHNYGRRHMDGSSRIIGSPGLTVADVEDAWKRLAVEFKNFTNIWAYGIMNEPHDMLATTPWFDIAQGIISGIRAVDMKTPIAVGGDSWSSAARWKSESDNLKNLSDPADNLVFEAHVYFDKDASGAYKNSYEEELASPYIGVERLKPFIQWLAENNKRGFIGEYGVPDTDERWLVTLDNMYKYLNENNVNGTYWAAGPRWGKYRLAIQPRDGVDRPQMKIVERYPYAGAF